MSIELLLGRLDELRSAISLEETSLYPLVSVALKARGETGYQTIALFVVASVLTRLANLIEGQSTGEIGAVQFAHIFDLMRAALSAQNYAVGERPLVDLINALSPTKHEH